MKMHSSFQGEDFVMSEAILLRTDRSGASVASIHPVEVDGGGVPRIGAGELMTWAFLDSLVRKIIPSQAMQVLPEHILASGYEGVMWWSAPRTTMMWFNTDAQRDGLGLACGRVPVPGLVFFASGKSLWVWAVRGNTRPHADTPLFQAPFYNVSESGSVCTGNGDLPGQATIEATPAWERSFFTSRFTHPNVHISKRLTKHRLGAAGMWKMLLRGRHKVFPEKYLVELGTTVSAQLQELTHDE